MARSNSIVNLTIASLAVLAFVVNFFPIPFFTGSALVFGNVIAVAVTILFGLRLGFVVSLLAGLATYASWSHFLILLPFLLEIVVVHFGARRHQTPLLYGIIYWLTLGWVIVGIEYFLFTDYLQLTKLAIMVKYAVNGILNVLLGYLLAHVLNALLKLDKIKSISLSTFITLTIFYSVTISVLANAYYWLRTTQEDKLTELQNQLQLEATHVGIQLKNVIEGGVKTVTMLADIESEYPEFDRDRMLNRLGLAAKQHPNFLTMLTADSEGQVNAAYPNTLMAKVDSSFKVDQRFYFYEPKNTLKPVVSEVFLGKGFGSDPIVALSAPVIRDNRFDGIVEASLDLAMFNELDKQLIDQSQRLVILDNNNRVIYRSEDKHIGFLQDMTQSPMLQHLTTGSDYFYIDQNGEYEIAESQMVLGLNWRVVVSVPRSFYEYQISSYVATSLLILVGFILALFIIVSRLALHVSQPISELARRISWASKNKKFEFIELNLKSSLVTELNEMSPVIQRFAGKLQRTLERLKLANDKAQKANDELEVLNQSLAQEVEEQTKALRLALNEANHANNAKSSFLATMSHEIRTPMNGVLGMLELLKQSELSLAQKENVDVAKSSASTLLNLINDILDFSKLDAGKVAFEHLAFDLSKLLNEVVLTHKHLSENPSLSIRLQLPSDKPMWFKGDPTRVRQVVVNLLSNAIKFTDVGEVLVDCRVNSGDDSGQLVEIHVKDTGIGIGAEQLKHLFDPFTQADASTTRKYGGTGLGLSIAKQLCNLMAGDIEAKSTEGEGSEFIATMMLPSTAAVEDEVAERKQKAVKPCSKRQILLVEDNVINQTVAKKMLASLGHNVVVAANGLEALSQLKHESTFDLILMDCQMPEMDGFEATREIRSGTAGDKNKDIAIVALTANAMKGDKEKCLEAGMDLFLTKPIKLDALERAIAEVSS